MFRSVRLRLLTNPTAKLNLVRIRTANNTFCGQSFFIRIFAARITTKEKSAILLDLISDNDTGRFNITNSRSYMQLITQGVIIA